MNDDGFMDSARARGPALVGDPLSQPKDGATAMKLDALPNPWMDTANPFDAVFDPDAFMDAVEAAPKFLSDPSPEYLEALWSLPLIEVLTAYR